MPIGSQGLFTTTDRLLERALDGLTARQRVTAHNIANVETPGFKRTRLSFEEQLKDAVGRRSRPHLVGRVTHPNHIPIGRREGMEAPFRAEAVSDTTMRNDGNNVDIEAEMAQLIKDQVQFNAVAGEVARRFTMLRDAITEGRR